MDLTHDEAAYLHELLKTSVPYEAMSGAISRKLERFFDMRFLAEGYEARRYLMNIRALEKAMRWHRVVKLCGYASSHSGTVSDRLVEPFSFLGDKRDVRAFELTSEQNKTFKLSRIARVELLDDEWEHEDQHQTLYTDLFLFSGEELYDICLRFDVLARNLFLEEYPHAGKDMEQEDRLHWLLRTRVVRYEAVSRFILGIWNHVEVLENDELKEYLRQRVDEMVQWRNAGVEE